ncbi:tRNA (guanine(10)-N(2))-dimethyltransferase [archaeon CG10_big_fil_rev_8_21_14_0_10_43_11]|nr:MAG: tRNA (guanine(10)-N(2))-dimethyltransferase [archaeon CG10_big_fil_rev_8_21_14_0_10_43_11]
MSTKTTFKEGKAEFHAFSGTISKKLDVFYNPDKAIDRDLNVMLMRYFTDAFEVKTGLELLAASGVRGIRLAKERGMVMTLNDINPDACALIKENAKKNKVSVEVHNDDANRFLKNYRGSFDYIDIDPFGTPMPFLESALLKLRKKNGVLAITATDSSALCGSYPKACMRKYASIPLKTAYCHELGVRILIKSVILAAAKYDIALTPLFSYARRDYMRVYFGARQGATRSNELLSQIGYFQHNFKTLERGVYIPGKKAYGTVMGPLWLGPLWDDTLMAYFKNAPFESPNKTALWNAIERDAQIKTAGFYHLPNLFSKTGKNKKRDVLIAQLEKKGFRASKTHFSPQGIRTNACVADIKKALRT